MSTRWLYELAIPGRPDISSVYASYACAAVAGVAFALARITDFWPLFTLGLLGLVLQVPLLIGICIAKFRASLPPNVGHAKMFAHPEPFEEIGWLKAFGGFVISAIVVTAFLLRGGGGAV